ncbi:hypothetical protein HDU91_002300 [Kappamyces sp. JEL0680]|nr:hypothetical protein HDU91_002300 [Kappamyces sp. JEL0680]
MVKINLQASSTSATCTKLLSLHETLTRQTQGKDRWLTRQVPPRMLSLGFEADVIQQLIGLTSHKDKQIKILSTCCLSDILRIYAPTAPLGQKDLIHLFSCIFKQLSTGLVDTSNPLYSYYFYLLESTSTIKSVVLLGDLNADALVMEAFEDFFDLIKYGVLLILGRT